MDELVDLVVKKTGVSEAIAEKAIEVVIGYLKKKLPAPIAGQIDAFLGGEGLADNAEDLLKGLGNLLQ